ncbi:UNVERIFIED_CONTAM: hypothetical protein K2H54_057059 [Gekko kuhli]
MSGILQEYLILASRSAFVTGFNSFRFSIASRGGATGAASPPGDTGPQHVQPSHRTAHVDFRGGPASAPPALYASLADRTATSDMVPPCDFPARWHANAGLAAAGCPPQLGESCALETCNPAHPPPPPDPPTPLDTRTSLAGRTSPGAEDPAAGQEAVAEDMRAPAKPLPLSNNCLLSPPSRSTHLPTTIPRSAWYTLTSFNIYVLGFMKVQEQYVIRNNM